MNSSAALAHGPYVDSLPPASSLLTPLQFTPPELEFLRGTNLAGAVEDRRREWQTESEVVRDVLGMDGLTW